MDRLPLGGCVGARLGENGRHQIIVYSVERFRRFHFAHPRLFLSGCCIQLSKSFVSCLNTDIVGIELGQRAVILLPVVVEIANKALMFRVPFGDDLLLSGDMGALLRADRRTGRRLRRKEGKSARRQNDGGKYEENPAVWKITAQKKEQE